METKIIRPIIQVGNSSGVILPKEWLNQRAEVHLITNNPMNILSDTLNILNGKVKTNEIMGIYVAGSHARKENRLDSDIDIIVITMNIDMTIKKGRYEISVVSKKKLDNYLKENIIHYVPMIAEAKPLLNEYLIKKFLENIKITKKNVEWYINTTKVSVKENEDLIEISKKLKEIKIGDAVAYSLVLRIRGFYILDCLKDKKLWNNHNFVKMIKKISGSDVAYKRYIYLKKDNNQLKDLLPLEEGEKLLSYLKDKLEHYEKWLKE